MRVLFAQMKVDRWVNEWCLRQGIPDHGPVVKMGLEKAAIDPLDWISTLRNLSEQELLDFIAAAKEGEELSPSPPARTAWDCLGCVGRPG